MTVPAINAPSVGDAPPQNSNGGLQGAQPNAASGASSSSGSSNSLLGDLGSLTGDLGGLFTGSSTVSNLGTDLSNLFSNPTFDAGALIGAGEYEAGQAQKDTANLTSQLTTPSQPFVSGANTELSQTMAGLTGNGTAPPPGSSIAQQEQAAKELGDVATQYGTGQLTSAQQSQVQQYIAQQKQQIRSQLAQQGVTDSSVIAMYDEQIDNNAAQLTQQLVSQNLGISQQALSSVQNTYNNLLNQSISQFTAGMGPIEDAVNLTVQQNTAIAGELNSLFGQIARGMGQAASGSSTGGSSGGSSSSTLSTLGSVLKGASSLYGDLSGDSLSAFGSQAAAGTASELGSAAAPALAADTAGALAPAVGAAPTAAELGTTADALAPIATDTAGTGAAVGSGTGAAAGSGAGSSALGIAGALAIPAAIAAAGLMTHGVSIPQQTWTDMLNTVQAGKNAGYTLGNPPANPNAPGPNGAPSWADWESALTELQTGADQPSNGGVRTALNDLGYQEYYQMPYTPTPQGPSADLGGLVKSF